METVPIGDAAELFGVSAATVSGWIERFEFPRFEPGPAGGGLRGEDVLAIMRHLASGHSISAAILGARVTVDMWVEMQAQGRTTPLDHPFPDTDTDT